VKRDPSIGLALGHMIASHGENLREELELVKPYFRFRDLKESRGLNIRIREVAKSDTPFCGLSVWSRQWSHGRELKENLVVTLGSKLGFQNSEFEEHGVDFFKSSIPKM